MSNHGKSLKSSLVCSLAVRLFPVWELRIKSCLSGDSDMSVKVVYSHSWQSWLLVDGGVPVAPYDTQEQAEAARLLYIGGNDE